MGSNPPEDNYPVFEIDENEIIGNNQIIYWMFGMIDRISKECCVFCVLYDRTSNNLMKIIKDNILAQDMDFRIYSDALFLTKQLLFEKMVIY